MRLAIPIAIWAACVSTAASPAEVLTYSGYGAVRFGMPLAEAERAVGQPSKPEDPGAANESCHYVVFPRYHGVSFMLEDGRVVRADLDHTARNILGLAVGMKLSYVRAHYPGVIVRPGSDQDHELVFKSRGGEPGEILAVEWDGAVMGIRGGILPAVEYVEGCL